MDLPRRRERIVYTRYDGGVDFLEPMAEAMAWMTGGGGYWGNAPLSHFYTQMERAQAAGLSERAARRFYNAMQYGGKTDAEALEIICDRDAGHLGTAHELYDVADVPADRWFRNAWRRSPNGGPIYIDMRKARKIQRDKIADFAEHLGIEVNGSLWRERIRWAKTPEDLKRVRPREYEKWLSLRHKRL